MGDSGGGAVSDLVVEQPVPTTTRRPRVREVSSRFMSPLIQSNLTPRPSDLPRSKSVSGRQPPRIDENHMPNPEKSSSVFSPGLTKHHIQRGKQIPKENNSDARVLSRADTPIAIGTDRVVPSRYRRTPKAIRRSGDGSAAVTAATRLIHEATSVVEKKLPRVSTSTDYDSDSCSSDRVSSCPNSPLFAPSTKPRSTNGIRSSLPEADKWLAERNLGFSGKPTSDCVRSLNFSSSLKNSTLPPHPSTSVKLVSDVKKGTRIWNQLEDVHSLKMLANHYMQWRFANAKAVASMYSQKQDVEAKLYSLGRKIADMRENVKGKRSEVAGLRRIEALTNMLQSQVPYLEEWTRLEEEYTTSLSSTIDGLLNSSIRIPISGEVRADPWELREAMGSALEAMELIGSHIRRFKQRAGEVDKSLSELARIVGGERALIEECGCLVNKAHLSQVMECSLRSTAMQIKKLKSTEN